MDKLELYSVNRDKYLNQRVEIDETEGFQMRYSIVEGIPRNRTFLKILHFYVT